VSCFRCGPLFVEFRQRRRNELQPSAVVTLHGVAVICQNSLQIRGHRRSRPELSTFLPLPDLLPFLDYPFEGRLYFLAVSEIDRRSGFSPGRINPTSSSIFPCRLSRASSLHRASSGELDSPAIGAIAPCVFPRALASAIHARKIPFCFTKALSFEERSDNGPPTRSLSCSSISFLSSPIPP